MGTNTLILQMEKLRQGHPGRMARGIWVCQGYFGASTPHQVTFCCQFP